MRLTAIFEVVCPCGQTIIRTEPGPVVCECGRRGEIVWPGEYMAVEYHPQEAK